MASICKDIEAIQQNWEKAHHESKYTRSRAPLWSVTFVPEIPRGDRLH